MFKLVVTSKNSHFDLYFSTKAQALRLVDHYKDDPDFNLSVFEVDMHFYSSIHDAALFIEEWRFTEQKRHQIQIP